MAEGLLRLTRVSKSFSGVQALRDVSLTIEPGEIHCLVGQNGSGKSTLIKIIAGVVMPDAGEISIHGRHYARLHPIETIHAGIQIIYQDFSLFPNLTVAENIALNDQLAQGRRLVNWRDVRRVAQEALDRIEVQLDLDARVEEVSVANKQLIAIARAILRNARLIVMDEPTTALTRREVAALFRVVRTLQQLGISILFVSHKLAEVFELADRVMVLRNGETVIDAPAREFDQRKLVYYMTGRDYEEERYEFAHPPNGTRPLLKVERLTSPGAFTDVSFELRAGEIVGLAGLLGSGRTELALSLFGIHPAAAGTVSVDGRPERIAAAEDALRTGIGYVPEDRLTEGLFLEQSIGRNIVVRTIDRLLGRAGLLDSQRVSREIDDWVHALSIKTREPTLPARTLSGGNQQRVVLAKWLASKPRVLILNGPTVGVDIGSKSELHDIIRQLARQGMGLLVISDDAPELLSICNRILLMRRGRLVQEFNTRELGEAELTRSVTEA